MTNRDRCDRLLPTVVVLAWACGLAALAGCGPEPQQQEFLSRHTVLANYNARAEAISRLWSRCHIDVDMPKPNSDPAATKAARRETYSADGHFIFAKPRNLILQGKAPFVGAVFGLHSNQDEYWFWVKPGQSCEWKGRHGGPGQDRLFLRPDRLLEALGMFAVPADGRAVFRRDAETDVIQVLAESPLPPEANSGFSPLYATQEIHLDRLRHDPVSVRLLSPSGEPLVVSQLSDYREVDGQRVPGTMVVRFLHLGQVRSETVVTLKLKDTTLTKDLSEAAFAYRTPPVDRHVDVDSDEPR